MAAKANSKSCQTSEMELFPQVVTGFGGELRILPNILDEAFCKNSEKLKAVPYFCKTSVLDVLQGSGYAFESVSKVKDVSSLNQFEGQRQQNNLLLGKTKKKEPNELQIS